jgi:hypothetical protein
MSAPERIWAARGLYDCAPGQRYPNTVEYRRADLPPTLAACLAHPEIKALVEAAQIAIDVMEWVGGGDCTVGIDALHRALAAIIAKAGDGE